MFIVHENARLYVHNTKGDAFKRCLLAAKASGKCLRRAKKKKDTRTNTTTKKRGRGWFSVLGSAVWKISKWMWDHMGVACLFGFPKKRGRYADLCRGSKRILGELGDQKGCSIRPTGMVGFCSLLFGQADGIGCARFLVLGDRVPFLLFRGRVKLMDKFSEGVRVLVIPNDAIFLNIARHAMYSLPHPFYLILWFIFPALAWTSLSNFVRALRSSLLSHCVWLSITICASAVRTTSGVFMVPQVSGKSQTTLFAINHGPRAFTMISERWKEVVLPIYL